MATTEERVSVLEGIIPQMNERLGNIEATLRDMNNRMNGMATTGELRAWAGVIIALIGAAVTILLRYR
jgi:hypothetical protein